MRFCECGCGGELPERRWPSQPQQRYLQGHHYKKDAKFPLADKSAILLSPEDEDLREKYRWRISARGYVIGGDRPHQLHRKIMVRIAGAEAIIGMHVDHINENKMDNRRENLRILSHALNQQNQHKRRPHKRSNLPRGVYRAPSGRYYVATSKLQPDGTQKGLYLGTFDTVEECVRFFDRWKQENCPGYIPMDSLKEAS